VIIFKENISLAMMFLGKQAGSVKQSCKAQTKQDMQGLEKAHGISQHYHEDCMMNAKNGALSQKEIAL